MALHTYRARSLQEALRLVRDELGPDASVLHTREVSAGLLRWIGGGQQIEVTASADVQVASRLPTSRDHAAADLDAADLDASSRIPPAELHDFRRKFREDLKDLQPDAPSPLEELCRPGDVQACAGQQATIARLCGLLAAAQVPAAIVAEWNAQLQQTLATEGGIGPEQLEQRLQRLIEAEISIGGPIRVTSAERRLVALVGPTGVGKTTTIAKLAANFRLRQRRRVGLITVDTYRIAAVDQLRTYADIMDLPMEVVATPREMREAVARFADFDLVLMDTAGRSPRDEVRIQELRAMLAEAAADEVHLVLSTTAGLASLHAAVNSFARVGATSLVLTKLDEAPSLGSLLPLLRDSRLPLSYATDGQNVPDDIHPADRRRLAQMILGTRAEHPN
jgi:flagellar biosynthesis protein FlhF